MRNWSKISLKKLDVLNSILFLEISLYFELTIKFSKPPNGHSAHYLRAFRFIFHTRKKMKSGYNFLSHADYQNVRNSNVLPLPDAAAPHLFATDSSFRLESNQKADGKNLVLFRNVLNPRNCIRVNSNRSYV